MIQNSIYVTNNFIVDKTVSWMINVNRLQYQSIFLHSLFNETKEYKHMPICVLPKIFPIRDLIA